MAEEQGKRAKIGFWVLTGLLVLAMCFSGVANTLHAQGLVDIVVGKLGYPEYVHTIIGPAKLIAAAIIAAPKLPRLKEWAYAGLTIDFTGAIASYVLIGEAGVSIAPPTLLLCITLGSYFLRPASRRLAD